MPGPASVLPCARDRGGFVTWVVLSNHSGDAPPHPVAQPLPPGEPKWSPTPGHLPSVAFQQLPIYQDSATAVNPSAAWKGKKEPLTTAIIHPSLNFR